MSENGSSACPLDRVVSNNAKEKDMNVLKLIEIGLKTAPGHDGLVVPGECGCLIGDLSPGNCLTDKCLAGYKHTHSQSGEWIVSTKREGVTDEEIAETVALCG